MKKEEWRFVVGYEGLYMVSNLGSIKSLKRDYTLKQFNNSGYLQVCLYKNGKHKWYLVHRLVWEAFNGPIPEGMQINHISERKDQNNLENLCLMTCKQNNNWGSHYARTSASLKNRTDISKQVLQYSIDGVFLNAYPSASEAHRQTGIHRSNICSCCRGTKLTAGGFVWRYD